MELSAIAGLSSGRGTNCGTTACQAGAIKAAPVPIASVKAIKRAGVIFSCQTSSASVATMVARITLITISIRRLSHRSAKAPASSAKQNTGNVVAACTSVTTEGVGFRVVISQPAPTSCIQVPVFDTKVAVHKSAKAL